jgi:signal transduction histidine kinase
MADFPGGYEQLLRGQQFQFCPLDSEADGEPIAVLACPIADNQDVLGDLWLIKQNYHCFNEQDLRLSQQVANYCAIALRQSRLYQASQAQVTELEKLNQLKDDFLSTVSHELRTPMANIKMATQMLTVLVNDASDTANRGSEQPASLTLSTASFQKVDRYLQILQHECQREIRLINDLLDLSRLNAGTIPLTLSKIDLRQFLSRIAEPFLARASEHHQQLQLDLPDHLPLLISEETSLERIVIELLNNACKYTPPNETIVVKASFQSDECSLLKPDDSRSGRYTLTRSYAEEGAIAPHFQISVLNSGVYIPPDELAHIFDKFYRIPNNDPWKHGGTGLGLALAQKLTEHLDGSLQVSSQSDQICFTVKLPAR